MLLVLNSEVLNQLLITKCFCDHALMTKGKAQSTTYETGKPFQHVANVEKVQTACKQANTKRKA